MPRYVSTHLIAEMEKKTLRIVYMGTPDFAVEPLKKLVEDSYNVVGVVTMPDKPAGRGYQLQQSAVKKFALERNLPLLQPENLKDEGFLTSLREWNADLQIVVAFRMLPEVVWNMPKYGTFNLHASLLPQYRGAAPINWAVINGDKETGVTTFFLKHEIDTGNIIMQSKVSIGDDENVGDIHDKLMYLGASVVTETVDLIISGNYILTPQDESIVLKPAPKIFKDTCRIDWSKSVIEIKNFVRGLSPYPAAFTEVKDEKDRVLSLKIYDVSVEETKISEPSGVLLTDNKTYLKFTASDGYVQVHRLQLAGKKTMDVQDLLRGTHLKSVE